MEAGKGLRDTGRAASAAVEGVWLSFGVIATGDLKSMRRFMPVILLALAAPLTAQESTAPLWTISMSAGPGIGGPMGQMRERLLAEQWTDQYCDYRRSDCHQAPTASGVSIQVAGSIARRIGEKLELKAVAEVGDLGQIIGAKGLNQIKASWKTATLATAVILHPMPLVRIGGGPMIGMLTRQAIAPAPNNPIHFGMLFEGGVRSSERRATFVELVVSYRLLPRLPEGPWPGNGQSSQTVGGPSGFDANFSHFTLGIGAGVRF